jgi:hypothetical protein
LGSSESGKDGSDKGKTKAIARIEDWKAFMEN